MRGNSNNTSPFFASTPNNNNNNNSTKANSLSANSPFFTQTKHFSADSMMVNIEGINVLNRDSSDKVSLTQLNVNINVDVKQRPKNNNNNDDNIPSLPVQRGLSDIDQEKIKQGWHQRKSEYESTHNINPRESFILSKKKPKASKVFTYITAFGAVIVTGILLWYILQPKVSKKIQKSRPRKRVIRQF